VGVTVGVPEAAGATVAVGVPVFVGVTVGFGEDVGVDIYIIIKPTN